MLGCRDAMRSGDGALLLEASSGNEITHGQGQVEIPAILAPRQSPLARLLD